MYCRNDLFFNTVFIAFSRINHLSLFPPKIFGHFKHCLVTSRPAGLTFKHTYIYIIWAYAIQCLVFTALFFKLHFFPGKPCHKHNYEGWCNDFGLGFMTADHHLSLSPFSYSSSSFFFHYLSCLKTLTLRLLLDFWTSFSSSAHAHYLLYFLKLPVKPR